MFGTTLGGKCTNEAFKMKQPMKNSKIEALDVSDLPKFLFRKVHPKLAYSLSLPVFPRLCPSGSTLFK